MSRKNRSNKADAEYPFSSRGLVAAAVVVLVVALVAATVLYENEDTEPLQSDARARQAALASDHSPTFGDPGAKVHIVEFLDPACGTCALFFPIVKQWMTAYSGEVEH